MTFKPVDTAIVMVVGPCIDDTDMKTLEEAIAYNAAGMDVSLIVEKTDGTTIVTAITLTTGGTSDWTHIDGGYYEVEVTVAQNAEEGIAYLRGVCTGVLPFESSRYDVVKANVYDSLVKGTDVLQTDVTQLAGDTQSITDFKDLVDTGYNPTYHTLRSDIRAVNANDASAQYLFDLINNGYNHTTHKVQGVVLVDTVTTNSDMRGTDSAALATALSTHDGKLDTVDSLVDTLITRLTAARAGYLDNLSAGAVALDAGVDLTKIHGVALTETIDGYLAAAFTKLFDVVTPLLVASDVMRGTDSAALAATALTDVTWTDAKAAFLDHSIATVDGNVDAILLDTGTDGVLLSALATSAQLIDDNWDEILTGATHNIATSAGRRVREIGAFAIHSGTAQAGNSIHLTLSATASATDGIYNRNLLVIVSGTGAGQTRTIIDYDGATKVALADREWRVSPDATSEYQITPDDTPLTVDHGLVQDATSTTIKIRDYASAVDDTYLCNIVIILAGTGRGQARLVSSYNGTTKVITICGDNWVTTPDTDSIYALIPYGASCVGCLSDPALVQINGECDTALTDYDGPTRTEATSDKDEVIVEINASETKVDAVQVDLTAVKGKTDNLPSGIAKGVALPKFDFLMVLSLDHVTGAAGRVVSGTISKDGGAFSAITNTITEVSSGMYVVASGFTDTEMNADVVTLRFTAASCDDRIVTIHTT